MTIDEATERKRAVVERRVGCGDFEGTGDRHKHGGVRLVEVGPSASDESRCPCIRQFAGFRSTPMPEVFCVDYI